MVRAKCYFQTESFYGLFSQLIGMIESMLSNSFMFGKKRQIYCLKIYMMKIVKRDMVKMNLFYFFIFQFIFCHKAHQSFIKSFENTNTVVNYRMSAKYSIVL